MKKLVIDATTGAQELVDLTADEIAALEEAAARAAEEQAQREAEEAARAAAKQAAQDKLAALGLTPEEIAAITA